VVLLGTRCALRPPRRRLRRGAGRPDQEPRDGHEEAGPGAGEQTVSSALLGLNQIPGVIGSAIFNQADECVTHMMPPLYDPNLLALVMTEVRNALTVLAFLDENGTWTAIVIRYEGGYLVVRQFGRTTIMVIAQPTLNPAMLSVGFNVAALKLEKEGLPPPPLPPPPLPPVPARM